MFKLPQGLSVCPTECELADYAELMCWQQGSISQTELTNLLGRLGENDYSEGVPEDDDIDKIVEKSYTEFERRKKACGGGYPFEIKNNGYTLFTAKETINRHIVYKYLLLATRLNMKNNRCHENINGTFLFEELAAEIVQKYLGDRAESLVFRTASPGNFEDKVNHLCSRLMEGKYFVNRNDASPRAQDDKLDIVAWKHFSDRLPGKLIAFGQCKTGTHYKDTLSQLQPDVFCRKWLSSSPAFPPIRMFFIAEALSVSHWYTIVSDAGLLFDRCRIIDFCNCDNIDTDVLKKVTIWTDAAAKATALQGGSLD